MTNTTVILPFNYTEFIRIWDNIITYCNNMVYDEDNINWTKPNARALSAGDVTPEGFDPDFVLLDGMGPICGYAEQFEYKKNICENCPFDGIDSNRYCLNGAYINLYNYVMCMKLAMNEEEFNYAKQIAIKYGTEIRNKKVKKTVDCV